MLQMLHIIYYRLAYSTEIRWLDYVTSFIEQ